MAESFIHFCCILALKSKTVYTHIYKETFCSKLAKNIVGKLYYNNYYQFLFAVSRLYFHYSIFFVIKFNQFLTQCLMESFLPFLLSQKKFFFVFKNYVVCTLVHVLLSFITQNCIMYIIRLCQLKYILMDCSCFNILCVK